MKIVLMGRDSLDFRFLSQSLYQRQSISGLIIETGKKAKKRKLKRMFHKNPFWLWPKFFLDLVAIYLYGNFCTQKAKEWFGNFNYPLATELPQKVVNDANDPECIHQLNTWQPDLLLIYGTSILRPSVFEIPKYHTINIHGGVVPHFRNVHSDFWAFYLKEYHQLGISLMVVNKGIDTGNVIKIQNISLDKDDTLWDAKKKLTELSLNMVQELLDQFQENPQLAPTKQDQSNARSFPTPGFKDHFLFWTKGLNKVSS